MSKGLDDATFLQLHLTRNYIFLDTVLFWFALPFFHTHVLQWMKAMLTAKSMWTEATWSTSSLSLILLGWGLGGYILEQFLCKYN